MKLYKFVVANEDCLAIASYEPAEATLDDIKAYLAEQGMVCVPLIPTESMLSKGVEMSGNPGGCYEAMIRAAQNTQQ